MNAILVVNAGSSSLKFQVFATNETNGLRPLIKGQMEGIGMRPRLHAEDMYQKPSSRTWLKVRDVFGSRSSRRRIGARLFGWCSGASGT